MAQSTKQLKRLNWSSQRLAWVLMFILMGSIFLLLISVRISYVSAVAFSAWTSLAIQALLQLLDLSKNKLGDLDSPAEAHITVGGRVHTDAYNSMHITIDRVVLLLKSSAPDLQYFLVIRQNTISINSVD